MKITLIQPKLHMPSESIKRLVPPLSLLYLASSLEQKNFDVSIIDSPCEGYENVTIENGFYTYGLSDSELIKRIEDEKPDVVGVTCSFSSHIKEVLHTCSIVKSVNSDIPIVIGGLHPTYQYHNILTNNPSVDFVIMKEGEHRFPNLLEYLDRGYTKQDGIAFRKNGKIIINPPTEVIKDLDSLPFPARHLIDMEKYIKIGLFSNPFPKGNRVGQILTSRGCPYNCNFCATKPYWGNFRARSVENIIEEMKFLKSEYHIDEIQFRDDNLLVDRERAFRLFEEMKELDLYWCVGLLVSNLDGKMLKAMSECGCYQLTISIESASERILKEVIHKPIDLSKIRGIVKSAHRRNIRIHSANIIGMPTETREEMELTFTFNKSIGVDSVAYFIATPYLGSNLYEQCKDKGWIDENYWDYNLKVPSIKIPKDAPEYIMSNKEIVELADKKTREFNDWKKESSPEMWDDKFSKFLDKHHEDESLLKGRVV